jgi:beta-galactosidase GanA
MGFNAISFYVFWGILEPKRGEISFEGFRDLQPFFDAAMKAGIYLIARPGLVAAHSPHVFSQY